jgi:hypothetical protein
MPGEPEKQFAAIRSYVATAQKHEIGGRRTRSPFNLRPRWRRARRNCAECPGGRLSASGSADRIWAHICVGVVADGSRRLMYAVMRPIWVGINAIGED